MSTYRFRDPEKAVVTMKKRGYAVVRDRATGTLFARSDKLVLMWPDGEASAISPALLPRWCARLELSEVADGREVRRW